MQDTVAERSFYEKLFEDKPENEHITDGYEELHDLAFPDQPTGRVFDLGCGTGAHAIRLAQRGLKVVACDLTRNGVRSARERFRAAGLEGSFLVADAEFLPFRDGAMEVTWTSLLLHHFPKLDRLPAELVRVTRSRLIAFEPNAYNALTFLTFNVINRVLWKRLHQITRNQRALRPASLAKLFRRFGYEMNALHFIDRPWRDGMSGLRAVYHAVTRPLPLRFRANKFLIGFQKIA